MDPAEVAVVRLPLADLRGGIVGYELTFARSGEGASSAINARATAEMLTGAFSASASTS